MWHNNGSAPRFGSPESIPLPQHLLPTIGPPLSYPGPNSVCMGTPVMNCPMLQLPLQNYGILSHGTDLFVAHNIRSFFPNQSHLISQPPCQNAFPSNGSSIYNPPPTYRNGQSSIQTNAPSSNMLIVDYGHISTSRIETAFVGTPAASCSSHHQLHNSSRSKCRAVSIDHFWKTEVFHARPHRIVIILRGLPGSGKSYVARAIRDKEKIVSSTNPRILSIDDYFSVESDDSKPTSEPKYEYNSELERSFRLSLLKSFKKTVDDGLYTFLMVDSCFEKVSYFEEFAAYAASKGFTVYVSTITADAELCKMRSVGRRTAEDIERIATVWEPTPERFLEVDVSSLTHPDINTVEMEDVNEEQSHASDQATNRKRRLNNNNGDSLDDEIPSPSFEKRSKWELLDATNEQIDRLDGLPRSKAENRNTKASSRKNEQEACAEDLGSKRLQTSKRHVSWSDVEQYKKSLNDRHNQFDRLLSEINARSALVKIHLI